MRHVALTDFCNMYGVVEFYKACKGEGIKPIIGCELMVAPSSCREKKKVYGEPSGYPLILLAKDMDGYRNLCKLSSIAFTEGFYYYPRIDKDLLQEHGKGLICLSGPYYSKVGSLITSDDLEGLKEEVAFMQSLFGKDYYFELSRHRISPENFILDRINEEAWLEQKFRDVKERQEKILSTLVELGQERGIGCVATNDIRYLERNDWQSHEILMNVASGEVSEIWEKDAYGNPKNRVLNPKRQTAYSHELYFKSPAEMDELFKDLPEAIENTNRIAEMCEVEFDLAKKFYPVYVPPHLEGKGYTNEERLVAAEAHLRELCEKGVQERYTPDKLQKVQEKYPDKDPNQVVSERLAYELDLIISKGMCDYLLIVYDFIAWAKNKGIPVGPGRGSGAGSIILYLIGITDIEPLRFNLFFERFINPERISYPDIDVDICMERRSEVLEYTMQKYGKDKVAQIITFGTMKAKMAIKDVGRVLSVPLSKVNAIAKLIPDDLGITIANALEIDADLKQMYKEDADTKKILDIAMCVEGSIRNTGIHAAGMIICGDPLTEHIPICTSKDSDLMVTQFSMKPVEQVGMLKIDFLGLKTLTSIQKAVDALKEHKKVVIEWASLPLDDKPTFDLLNQGKTSGIFQLESSGMQDLARQLHIDKFEEIIAVGALYRPGPMEMIPSFISRKHGKEKIEYDHPWLGEILEETYGIMVYQEQVMQMASKLAGYSLGEGDVLRRAMGKKDKEEMKNQRSKFRDGAVAKGISEATAMLIFDKVEKFASYGFNKSHAAAYGYLSYVTAFLKANYPGEWMAALMTCDMTDLSKVAKHIRECQSMQISILPPDINVSQNTFVATDEGVRFALAAIKGVGEGVVDTIVQERKKNGPFASLYSFLQRTEIGVVGKKVIEHLIQAGCFDFMGWTRQQLLVFLETHFDAVVKEKKDRAKGIMDMFAQSGEEKREFDPPIVELEPKKIELLSKEKELLGFYVTGHPLDECKAVIESLECTPMDALEKLEDRSVVKVACVVDTLQVRISQKTQRKFAILMISDGLERFELPIWPELFEESNALLEENALLIGVLQIDKREGDLRLSAKWLGDLKAPREELVKEVNKACQAIEGHSKVDRKRPGGDKAKMNECEKKEASKLRLVVDINSVRMSQILHLKQILSMHRGPAALEVKFQGKNGFVGQIDIDSGLGVTASVELQEQLKTLPCIVDLILEN